MAQMEVIVAPGNPQLCGSTEVNTTHWDGTSTLAFTMPSCEAQPWKAPMPIAWQAHLPLSTADLPLQNNKE